MKGGRVRPSPVMAGRTPIVHGQLEQLELEILALNEGGRQRIGLRQEREYALVLIQGHVSCACDVSESEDLGPRPDPYDHLPTAVLISNGGELNLHADCESILAIASAPTNRRHPTQIIRPPDVRERTRGRANWMRTVRLVCWSDNTTGDRLLVGETVTPSGNWSTIPPHRHAVHREDEGGVVEVPYEEIYYYRFSHPAGFGLNWQFDDDGTDQAFSLRSGDAVYTDGGYHPVVCGPGSTMYQLTLMSGPFRQSTAAVHPAYRYLLEDSSANPFSNQE